MAELLESFAFVGTIFVVTVALGIYAMVKFDHFRENRRRRHRPTQ